MHSTAGTCCKKSSFLNSPLISYLDVPTGKPQASRDWGGNRRADLSEH